jgi:hypothetical protein
MIDPWQLQQSRRLSFLKFPGEIHNMIYCLLLVQDYPVLRRHGNPNKIHPNVLQTCRQIFAEGSSILYRENTWLLLVFNTSRHRASDLEGFHLPPFLHPSSAALENQPLGSAGKQLARRFSMVIECCYMPPLGPTETCFSYGLDTACEALSRIPSIEYLHVEVRCRYDCREIMVTGKLLLWLGGRLRRVKEVEIGPFGGLPLNSINELKDIIRSSHPLDPFIEMYTAWNRLVHFEMCSRMQKLGQLLLRTFCCEVVPDVIAGQAAFDAYYPATDMWTGWPPWRFLLSQYARLLRDAD